MEDNIPKFDLPVDFIVGNVLTGEILNHTDVSRARSRRHIRALRTRDSPCDCKL